MVDPFCGSGTLLVEAALLADGVAPGLFRERFGLERLPGYDPRPLERLRAEARSRSRPLPKLQLVGSDRAAERVAEAEENLAAAGLAGRARLEVRDASELRLKRGWNGLLLTNPPYGERVGEEGDLRPLYRALGERLRQDGEGYGVALFSGNRSLERELGLELDGEVAGGDNVPATPGAAAALPSSRRVVRRSVAARRGRSGRRSARRTPTGTNGGGKENEPMLELHRANKFLAFS